MPVEEQEKEEQEVFGCLVWCIATRGDIGVSRVCRLSFLSLTIPP